MFFVKIKKNFKKNFEHSILKNFIEEFFIKLKKIYNNKKNNIHFNIGI